MILCSAFNAAGGYTYTLLEFLVDFTFAGIVDRMRLPAGMQTVVAYDDVLHSNPSHVLNLEDSVADIDVISFPYMTQAMMNSTIYHKSGEVQCEINMMDTEFL